jgi:hypothetical protein
MHLPATGIVVPLYAESWMFAVLSLGLGERLESRRFGITLHWVGSSIYLEIDISSIHAQCDRPI